MNKKILIVEDLSDPFADFLRIQGLCHRRVGKTRVAKGSTSVGVVFKRDKFGSMIQIQRIDGELLKVESRLSSEDYSCARNGLIRSMAKYAPLLG